MPDYNPDSDPRSSNVLIQSYLMSKGITPGMPGYAQSVRTALEANAANPGLIQDYASTLYNGGPPDADARRGAARASSGPGIPTPPIPPPAGNTSAQPTSAQPPPPAASGGLPPDEFHGLPLIWPGQGGEPPPSNTPPVGGPGGVPPAPVTPTVGAGIPPPDMSIAQQALLGIPLIGGGYAASRALSAPTVGPGSGQLQIAGPDVAAAAPALGGPAPQAQLEGPKPPLMIGHDPTAAPMLSAPAQPDPLQSAFNKATAPAGPEPVPVGPTPTRPDAGAASAEATASAPERAAEKVKRVRSRTPRTPKITRVP